MWMTLLFCGAAAVFVAMTLVTCWRLRWVRRLPAAAELPVLSRRVRCSVVIAARDEEARVEQTVRQVLAQRGADLELELVVVDDRSRDRTGGILERLARDEPRLRVRRVDVLPDGWLGKCHACHLGAAAATGDWILFTDADCWLKPDVLERALRVAEREGAEHVTLASGLAVKSPGLAASHLVFLMGAADWFASANRDCRRGYLGFGAFNLVRTDVYRRCGGYEALRLTVLDDVKLGLLVRRAGGRTRAFIGGDDVEAHWGTSALSIVKIMEKNYFAALDYRISLVAAGTLFMLLLSGVLLFGLLSGTWAGLAAALSPLTLIGPGWIVARRLGWPWTSALILPFLFPIFHYALLNSTWVALRQGGIRWRETFYSLAQLRAGTVR